jgi:hypothetical protein
VNRAKYLSGSKTFFWNLNSATLPVTSRPPGNLLLDPVRIQIERRLQLPSMQDASCAIDEWALFGLGSVWVYLIKTILKHAKHRLAPKSSGRPTRSLQRYLDRMNGCSSGSAQREGGKESFSCFMTMCYDRLRSGRRPAPSRPSKGSIQGGTYRPPVRSESSMTK